MRSHLLLLAVMSCSIHQALSAEVFPGKEGFDSYGGYLSIKGKATGRFHLEEINGRHYLVTPEGHGFLSNGVVHIGEISRPEKQSCDYLHEHCGGDWGKANSEILSNFREWGYNSLGYDSHPSTRELLPFFADCYPTQASSWRGKGIGFPDVFSDAWKQEARQALEWALREYGINDRLIGLYWTDIPAWDFNQARNNVGKTWVDAIRELPEDAPGKIRYKQYLKENGKNASDEDFLVLIARQIYSFIGPLTREMFPDTLIFGERYAAWHMPWKVIQEAIPYIDVVSVQPVAVDFPSKTFERLYRETSKPIMICDHQSSFTTPDYPDFMWNTVPDVATVAKAHWDYLDKGFSTTYLIGYNRCQYIDRFKHDLGVLKQGLLQVDGKPYDELVESVKTNNWRIHDRFSNKTTGKWDHR